MSIALYPLGNTPQERSDDYLRALDEATPLLGTRGGNRDLGSWPNRAPSVLRTFYEQCRGWHDWNLTPCDIARRTAFNSWLYQHGEAWIDAHHERLCTVLDALETRAREEAWCG